MLAEKNKQGSSESLHRPLRQQGSFGFPSSARAPLSRQWPVGARVRGLEQGTTHFWK